MNSLRLIIALAILHVAVGHFEANSKVIQQNFGIDCDSEKARVKKCTVPFGYEYLPGGEGAVKYHSRELTWDDARRACIEEGGHLVLLHSQEESELLQKMIQRHKEYNKREEAFIGYHDLFKEGEFVSVFGEPLTFKGWQPNEPNNGGGGTQNCVRLAVGGMDDIWCDSKLPFVCQVDLKNCDQ